MAYGGRSQQKMSEETFDFVCTTCAQDDKTIEAVKYCVECKGYCCKSCTDTHLKFPALKGHALMDVTQANQATSQQPRVTEFPIERCAIHAGKLLDMYCEGHDVVGCYVCFAKDHKSCQDRHIHSIPDMIDTLFKLSDYKQTHGLLKDLMISMQTLSKSRNSELQTLMKAKKEALDKVHTFQKALESILRYIAEASRNEVEAAYKELEKDIRNGKHVIDSIYDDLQTTDGKLNQLDENRAQRFVCMKIAHEKIKEADNEKTKQELKRNTYVQLSFIPNQSLMENIKALHGIGQLQRHVKQKHDLYTLKKRSNFTIKISNDLKQCSACGLCLTPDDQLIVTDCGNNTLKRFEVQEMSLVDYCIIDSEPYGVCCVSKHEVAVACQRDKKILFVDIHDKMTPSRQIRTPHLCFGIAFNDDKLYVTNDLASLYIYDVTGNLLNTVTRDHDGNKLFSNSTHVIFNRNNNTFCVENLPGRPVCLDGKGNYLETYKDIDPEDEYAVCVDGRGNVFIIGCYSIVQYSQYGNKQGEVVITDELQTPMAALFHQEMNRIYVTIKDCDILKMFELE